jgi:hypothetical protein
MSPITRQLLAAVTVLPLCAPLAVAEEAVLFSTGEPEALDLGDGSHYHGVQSIVSTNWYPTEAGETTAMGDWFELDRAARITGVTFWGLNRQFGGGPGELHVYVFVQRTGASGFYEYLHVWDSNTPDWSAYYVGEVDPSGLGTETVSQWHVRLGDLPNSEGDTCIPWRSDYFLVIAGDDWADEFQWAANAPDGLVDGLQRYALFSDTTDFGVTGFSWSGIDFEHGAMANNLAFEITGVEGPFGDVNGDCHTDLQDYPFFESCLSMSGPHVEPVPALCLTVCDADGDGDVDLNDFARFQESFD